MSRIGTLPLRKYIAGRKIGKGTHEEKMSPVAGEKYKG